MEVTIPANATATVYVSGAEVQAEGAKPQRVEDGASVFAVESGSYRFKTKGKQ